jgi:hypothetical protein
LICPKCGRPVEETAVICRGCDFILDTEFLGDGILDEEHSLRPGAGGVDPAAFNLADAVILGNIDDDSQIFETSDSGFHLKANLSARLYVSGRSQALMSPDAVPAVAQSAEGVRLTPFEKHVLALIDGKKPVEVIRRAAGLDEAEVKTALATLADKGVVKVVGRALADFDPGVETAARRAPPRHRMRGSVVGAVALVGDDTDRAIEDAFRTSVALVAPVVGSQRPPADGDVFAATGVGMRDSDLPSDVDQFVGLKGTDEVEKVRRPSVAPPAPPTSGSTVRPAVAKNAVNRAGSGNTRSVQGRPVVIEDSQEGIDASAVERSVVDRAPPEQSDGFDDFGQPSDVSTAVVAQEFSDSSTPSAASVANPRPDRGRSGVFADISNGDEPPMSSVQNLADSRVTRRPNLSSAHPPPHLASDHSASSSSGAASAPGSSPGSSVDNGIDETPSVEIERRAASGEVWDDGPRPETISGSEVKNLTGVHKTGASSSLSALLSDADDEATANVPPELAQKLVGGRRPPPPSESYEEPTAAGQPMPPLPLPRVGQANAPRERADKPIVREIDKPVARPPEAVDRAPPAVPSRAQVRPPSRMMATATPPPPPPGPANKKLAKPRPSAMVSMPDEANIQVSSVDERSGLHEVNRDRGAAEDIFDGSSGSFESPSTGPQNGQLSDDSTGDIRRAPPADPSASDRSMSSVSAARSVHDRGDETMPPSELPEPSGSERSEPEDSQRSAPPRSENAMSAEPSVPPSSDGSDRSVEMVDSALVIRPAAKVQPLAKPARVATEQSASVPRRPDPPPAPQRAAPPPPAPSVDDEPPPEEDSEDTLNLDEEQLKKRMNGRNIQGTRVGAAGNAAALPSGFSKVVQPGEGPRPKTTDENRRKARQLFDEARKEAAAGRMGAARMNIKLASIYDPENDEYRDQLDEWERPDAAPAPARPPTATAQSRQVSRPSDESQAEIKALYDEAQRFEDAGDIDAALDVLEQGVARFPNAAAFHNRMGVILALRKRDYDAAVQAIQRAIDIDPDNLHYKSNLGKIVAKTRRGAG